MKKYDYIMIGPDSFVHTFANLLAKIGKSAPIVEGKKIDEVLYGRSNNYRY